MDLHELARLNLFEQVTRGAEKAGIVPPENPRRMGRRPDSGGRFRPVAGAAAVISGHPPPV
jgi:hypothetical protein